MSRSGSLPMFSSRNNISPSRLLKNRFSRSAMRTNQGTYPGPVGRSTKSHETNSNKNWPFSSRFVCFRVDSWIVGVRPALSTLAGVLFQQPASLRRKLDSLRYEIRTLPTFAVRGRREALAHGYQIRSLRDYTTFDSVY